MFQVQYLEIPHPLKQRKNLMIKNTRTRLCAILIFLFQAGCSTQLMFATGQAYQQDKCLRMTDKLQRDFCMGQILTGYEEYKREKDKIGQ